MKPALIRYIGNRQMELLLCDKQAEIINACGDIEGLKVVVGDIFDHTFDTLITPGNSYAFMDGGFDRVVSEKLGWHIQKEFRDTWIENCELILVGQAISKWLNNTRLLIYAPTMIVPMDISNTWNVYLAMKAGLEEAKRNGAKKVGFPAFGCGCGDMSPSIFKKQLQAAINDYDKKVRFNSWQEAQAYYFNLIKED